MKKDSGKKTIVLLDSHAIIHRAYHALPDFMNSKGEPTGALYGLSTMLMKIVGELKPDYIFACFDLPKKTFRHEAYKDYKAGRAKADNDLVDQLKRSRDLLTAFNIPILDAPGFEADDVLGTFVEKYKDKDDVEIIVASGDMDTLQLVDGAKVKVYTLKKGINDTIIYDENAVKERFGFLPKFLPDYKGLRGDPSDNIIGIKGIGEKTATTIITEFGSIENLYEKIKKDGQEKVAKRLGLTPRIMDLITSGEDEAMFSKTLATIRCDAPVDCSLPNMEWKDGLDITLVENIFRELEFRSIVDRFKKMLDPSATTDTSVTKDEKVVIDNSFDKEDMEKAKIAIWLLNSDMANPTDEDVIMFKNAGSFSKANSLIQKAVADNNLEYVFSQIELPIMPIIKEMEARGVLLDIKYLEQLSKEYHKNLTALEKKIWEYAGKEFNINSPKQLGEILFDEMNLAPTERGQRMKKTAGGARSTKESELQKLVNSHPIIPLVLEYRELQKLLSTYIDTLPAFTGGDGRIHAHFLQTGTTTGRFGCENPNMQNIPVKSELGKKIRNAFITTPGFKMISFDYSQIELRIAALLSQDEFFIKVFKEGGDIHSAVAMKVFGVGESEITSEMRRRAKVINFGILYGMGVNALRQNLGGERKDAQIFYDNYFAQFPKIAGYLESVKEFAKTHGYTETLFGRRRYFPGIKSKIPFIRATAERMAINAPIQGTATADIIKIGMKLAHDAVEKNKLSDNVHLIMQIHDELIYEVKESAVDEAIDVIKSALENAIPEEFLVNLDPVPLVVSFGVGNNMGELK